MKKIIFLLAFALAISAMQTAQAANISTSGYFMITGEAFNNKRLLITEEAENTLKIYERVQLALDVDFTEDVAGQISFRLPYGQLYGSGLDGAVALEPQLRSAYIDFPVAMFDVRAGLQDYALPGFLGSGVNPIIDDTFAGFVANANFASISTEFAWFIPSYTNAGKSNIYSINFVAKPFDIIDFNHWFTLDDLAYDGETSNLYIGVNLDVFLNDISAGAACVVAKKDKVDDQHAFLVEGHISFDLAFMTPGLAVWYGKQGDIPMEMTQWGSFGGFNGSADSYFEMGNGLQDIFPVDFNDPFNSTGIYFSLADISLGNSVNLAAHALYVMDNTLNSSDSELELGTNIITSITNNLDFIVDAYYFMPLYEQERGKGALVACTLQANF